MEETLHKTFQLLTSPSPIASHSKCFSLESGREPKSKGDKALGVTLLLQLQSMD